VTVQPRPRHRRLEAFTTDAKFIIDASQFFRWRRLSSFSMAIATQLIWKIFRGDTPGPPTMWAPQKRGGRLPHWHSPAYAIAV